MKNAKRATRTRLERERDRMQIAHLRLTTHMPIAMIQEWLNDREDVDYQLSWGAVSNDLEYLKAEWRASALIDFNTAKARELAKIDELEKEFWEAWKRSIGEVIETIREEGVDRNGVIDKTTRREVFQAGDARYLEGVQNCIDKRIKILGLEAPKKVAPTTPDGTLPYDAFAGIATQLDDKIARWLTEERDSNDSVESDAD